jgi:hypothetical protein
MGLWSLQETGTQSWPKRHLTAAEIPQHLPILALSPALGPIVLLCASVILLFIYFCVSLLINCTKWGVSCYVHMYICIMYLPFSLGNPVVLAPANSHPFTLESAPVRSSVLWSAGSIRSYKASAQASSSSQEGYRCILQCQSFPLQNAANFSL